MSDFEQPGVLKERLLEIELDLAGYGQLGAQFISFSLVAMLLCLKVSLILEV